MTDKLTAKYDYKLVKIDTAQQRAVLDHIQDDRDTVIRNYKDSTDEGRKKYIIKRWNSTANYITISSVNMQQVRNQREKCRLINIVYSDTTISYRIQLNEITINTTLFF